MSHSRRALRFYFEKISCELPIPFGPKELLVSNYILDRYCAGQEGHLGHPGAGG
jgi:hypothetical protein